jgi:hypothetical protein
MRVIVFISYSLLHLPSERDSYGSVVPLWRAVLTVGASRSLAVARHAARGTKATSDVKRNIAARRVLNVRASQASYGTHLANAAPLLETLYFTLKMQHLPQKVMTTWLHPRRFERGIVMS